MHVVVRTCMKLFARARSCLHVHEVVCMCTKLFTRAHSCLHVHLYLLFARVFDGLLLGLLSVLLGDFPRAFLTG